MKSSGAFTAHHREAARSLPGSFVCAASQIPSEVARPNRLRTRSVGRSPGGASHPDEPLSTAWRPNFVAVEWWTEGRDRQRDTRDPAQALYWVYHERNLNERKASHKRTVRRTSPLTSRRSGGDPPPRAHTPEKPSHYHITLTTQRPVLGRREQRAGEVVRADKSKCRGTCPCPCPTTCTCTCPYPCVM